ncbi:MAG: redox-regulated ATPase YchF [Candidatus Margulisiibacteriota bacterium]
MSFSLGIVGLPNVGKSTLFNALTKNSVNVSNYPFCTIDKNVGIVAVPDERLLNIQKIMGSAKAIPTIIEFYDIAGLVKGAHKGEGLGNQFLSHIREVDAIVHVVRCFPDPNIVHVEGRVDPLKDIDTINLELILSDIQTLDRKLEKLTSSVKTGDKKIIKEFEACKKLREHLDAGKTARDFGQLDEIEDLALLTSKPVLFVASVDETGNPDQAAKIPGAISVCAPLEQGLTELIEAGYKLLELITFYTSNNKETRAWTVPAGTPVQKAAGKVHSDMERGFISAEIVSYNDLLAAGSYAKLRDTGRVHLSGRDYLVKDGDLVLVRFNV